MLLVQYLLRSASHPKDIYHYLNLALSPITAERRREEKEWCMSV